MRFSDLIYGSIEIPDWLIPFLKLPEFVRLRGVRLSNVDSYQFKDFNGPTRWDHCLGVAHLALRYCKKRAISNHDSVHIVLAALLHDVATPPFAHTVEYVIDGYDHELESNKILSSSADDNASLNFPVFASQTPQFRQLCDRTSKLEKIKIDPDAVAEMVTGGGKYGFLINGSIDLDNIDNVTRASVFLGIDVDRKIPYHMVDWLVNFESAPTELEMIDNASVQTWIGYKNEMYSKFYNSHDDEIGRQAYLQHLIRRAYNEGLSRSSIIWNTDEGLLNLIEAFRTKYPEEEATNVFSYPTDFSELVQRYRLLESAHKVFEIPIDDPDDFEIVKRPSFTDWLEQEITTSTFEPFVIINSKRFASNNTLFQKGGGTITVFKLGTANLKIGQLPKWIKDGMTATANVQIHRNVKTMVEEKVRTAIKGKPWLNLTPRRRESIKSNLDNVGNWSFRLSRNENIHSYPATFVHAIPSTLITALGLRGELILDPFGGTGQTAAEAVKFGCQAISSDSNSMATLVSKSRFTYLSKAKRANIRDIEYGAIIQAKPAPVPNFPDIDKWHHSKTIQELCKIKSFIEDGFDADVSQFLKVCFSDIITSCTARKGREHNYFADNTPLEKGTVGPPYENAINHFLNEINKNLEIIERQYSFFERNGLSAYNELSKVRVRQFDITSDELSGLQIEQGTVAGIVTSPPYLCMADYTLGQRLSYYWLFPELLQVDFNNEIGARRMRNSANALQDYLTDMRLFARNSTLLLKKHGFLATVIGAPVANAFKDEKILEKLDGIFNEEGLEIFWQTERPIHWHRNHGYARLRTERIAVFTKR